MKFYQIHQKRHHRVLELDTSLMFSGGIKKLANTDSSKMAEVIGVSEEQLRFVTIQLLIWGLSSVVQW